MSPMFTPLLAADTVELIITGVGLVIVIGGWIANAMKKPAPGQGGGQAEGPVMVDRRARLEELAARRRAQLEELARQRRGGAQAGPQSPVNLTAAEVQQRAAAREQYEKRAEALRRMREAEVQGQSPTALPTQAPLSQAPTARPAPRAQDLARQRAEQMAKLRAKRDQELAMQRQRAKQELERQMRQAQGRRPAPPAPPPAARPKPKPQPKPEPVLEAAAVLEEIKDPVQTIHEAYAITGGRRRLAAMDLRTMRQAVILKEILDPPVSMRSLSERF